MSSKNRDGKPTKFQLDALKALKADMKGIKTYRDAENALKRLRKAKKTKKANKPAKKASPAKKPVCAVKKALAKKDEADKCITVNAKKPVAGKCIAVKTTVKNPIQGTDEVRIKLPSCKCNKDADCRHLCVDISVIHDDIFSPSQMKNIDKLAQFCSDAIIKLCDSFAISNGFCEKALPVKKPVKPVKKTSSKKSKKAKK